MLLHTLNAGPGTDSFLDCLRSAQKGDAIVLLGEGVYCALKDSSARKKLDECPARLMALATDVEAAGLANAISGLPLIDMDAFVALSEFYPRQLAWY
ncbi:MAG: sulfurtransferase complex subunit TusB [Halioglobus sp.]